MTEEEALAQTRAFGRHVGSDRLIEAAVDGLVGVAAPSLPVLAGLGRSEEHEAQEQFDQVA